MINHFLSGSALANVSEKDFAFFILFFLPLFLLSLFTSLPSII